MCYKRVFWLWFFCDFCPLGPEVDLITASDWQQHLSTSVGSVVSGVKTDVRSFPSLWTIAKVIFLYVAFPMLLEI